MTNQERTSPRKRALRALACLAATLAALPNLHGAGGTWSNLVNGNASGSWTNAANWANNVIADGADSIADFSTLNITTNSYISLDGARTIGNIVLGDTTPDTNWILNPGLPSSSALTLAVGSGSPNITANSGSNTVAVAIGGVSGLTKAGAGTLRLNTASPNLQNLLFVNSGTLQIGNATGIGTNGNHLSNDRVICTNGGTIEIINAVQPNNKHLTLFGAGVGGTQGALYANATSGSTRWGLSSLNASGTSGNSSAAFPAISLLGDTAIRIDGDAVGNPTASFAIGHVSGTNATLTKTGGGRLSFDRGLSGITNVVVLGGGYMPNQASAFGSIQYYSVAPGAAILNNQNNCFSSSASVVMTSGSLFDIYNRSDVQNYTQTIGYLNGDGTLTAGMRGGAGGTTTLTLQGSDSNSVFNGWVTVSNAVRFNLTKSGTAALVLNGNTTHNGLTTVNGGTLTLNGTNTGLGGIVLNAGTLLTGTGTIASAITNQSGTIWAGNPAVPGSTLTVLSNIIGSFADTLVLSNANLSAKGLIGPDFQAVGTLYMTNATLEVPLRTVGASVFVSSLLVDGRATLKFSMATPLVGQFPIISYTVVGGLAGFGGLTLVTPPGITATLSNNVGSSTIDVVISSIPALTWEGSPAGIWNVGVGNWKGGAIYTESAGVGPFVVFDDTAAGLTAVTLGGTVSPQGITVNNATKSYTLSGSGKVSGTGGIAKQGTGTLTVTANNDFSGGVSLQQGTLEVGNGGTSGSLGSGSLVNLGVLALNRSDSFTLSNTVGGNGSITKAGAGTAVVPVNGDSTGTVTVNGGVLQLGPGGTSKLSGDVSGSGGFGVSGAGRLILTSFNNTYSGGTFIADGTLQFGDENATGTMPPAGTIADNGTLALAISGTLANDISGSGGLATLSNIVVTLTGNNTYTGPTVVSGTLDASGSAFPAGSSLTLGNQAGGADTGTLNFNTGNLVLGGLRAGGSGGTISTLNLPAGNQSVTVNGNLIVGNSAPSGAALGLSVTGTGVSLTIKTNGGVIQLGLGTFGSGVNPDAVTVDFSQVDSFAANLGATGLVNLGTLDGNPGPPAGATVLNQFKLAAVSNSITAGAIIVGAGGRQLIPELVLGAGTNVLNVNTFTAGGGGRDGSYVYFGQPTGGLRLRANDGLSRAVFNVGVNPATGTGAGITNTVDFTGHPVDLLVSTLVIGNYNNAGVYQNTMSFDTGTLDAQSTSLSVLRNNNANAPASSSTLSIGGGTVALGSVNLTASAAAGTLNITGGSVSVTNIASPGTGVATLNIGSASLTVNIAGFGNPATAPVAVDSLVTEGTVNLDITGQGFTVGQFPLISYAGTIGGNGFSAFNLVGLPSGVSASLVNNSGNQSVDVLVTAAPPAINPYPTNITTSVTGSQLELSWPSDHTGWLLLSNALSVVDTGSWFLVPGSTATNRVFVTIESTKLNVFYRLQKP